MGIEIWDLWYPNAAAQGLSFCRGRMSSSDAVLVHAAPDSLRVEVRLDDGRLLAFGYQLRRAGPYYPMTRLRRNGSRIHREDGWPIEEDIGRPVLLPGGEIGILLEWWNAADGSEWRWRVEFYNHT
ncbi:MAG: hypothetical protein HY675_02620 [Chloroflexi bacterium]|nr:hypothetical protein [Chloroflexota bacterium]